MAEAVDIEGRDGGGAAVSLESLVARFGVLALASGSKRHILKSQALKAKVAALNRDFARNCPTPPPPSPGPADPGNIEPDQALVGQRRQLNRAPAAGSRPAPAKGPRRKKIVLVPPRLRQENARLNRAGGPSAEGPDPLPKSKGGAPMGNRNRLVHGYYSQEAKARRARIRDSHRDSLARLREAQALFGLVRQVERLSAREIAERLQPDPDAARKSQAMAEALVAQLMHLEPALESPPSVRLSDPPLSESARDMAGHSQFKNIMHRKGRVDAVRSKVFSKLAREITVAAKLGMPDPAHNPRLRAAIIAAKAQSMPKDNIQRAIDKATGAGAENIEEVRYEGYGPGGVALIVETLTDNRNRTGGDVRSTFSKYGGALGEPNSVTFLFDRKGAIVYPRAAGSDDEMLEAAIEAGCDECLSDEDGHEFVVSLENYGSARDALEARFGAPVSAKVEWRPKTVNAVSDDTGESLVKLLDALDDFDDVQTIYGNYELSPALMEKLGG